jgi:serine/threonine protein kinase
MASNPQVLELLEEMLSSGKTPEEVCGDCLELLPELRERWREFRLIDAAVVELLPGLRTPGVTSVTCVPPVADLPQVPGYELFGEVGRGGMGVVYQARDFSLDRDVAVKLLQDSYPADSSIARRFTSEAKITAQLQHPGVPAVYRVGTLPDGRPFLAMKLIKGRTLAALLEERPNTAADRGRFVATFEQVCQAVGYAHAHNVIHRDLKPSNVMVGAFGEVQVMDWGLAKVLTARGRAPCPPDTIPDTAACSAIRPARDAHQETQAGSLLGTPAFMPPEQALAEIDKVNERADVFGLGAVLAVILTGKPPYVGESFEAVRVQAARGRLDDCFARLDVCGAEPELINLCKRCLAFELTDRPANAGTVAEAVSGLRAAADERARRAELDRVQAEGEAREAMTRATAQRQRRVLSGVIMFVLLAGLGVSLWQMFRAIGAETTAKENEAVANRERDAKAKALEAETKARQQAFAALRSMTAELVERKFAQGTALTADDREFLRGIIAQFDAFAAIKGEDAESRAVRAEGRLRVGWMRYRLGELREAENDYDQAVSIFKQLADDFPSRSELRRDLAMSHNNRGALLHATGRLPEADKDWNEAVAIYTQLATDFPSQPEFRKQLAGGYFNRGVLMDETGRLREAEEDYDRALSIRKQLAAEVPSRPEFRQDLASSHVNRGILMRNIGRLKDAETDYDQALSIQQQLVAEVPSRPEFRQDLAGSYTNRGVLLRGTRREKEAEKDYDLAVSIYKQLVAEFPSRPELRRQLASSHVNRGILLREAGRAKDAENDYDQALSIYKQLAADFPNQPDLRSELANSYGNLAHHHLQQGNAAAAKPLLLEGRPHHLAALKANSQHPAYREFYRYYLNVLTVTHAVLLEPEDAVRTAETCRDLNWDAPADAYMAACWLSRCVTLVAQHDKLDDTPRKQAVQFYGDAAMKLLGDAVSKGFTDVAHLKRDTSLDPLRQRDDFRKLVAELEGKGK